MVASAVNAPRMISTIGISGTGFMKCMPITRSGWLPMPAMRVIGIAEVLAATGIAAPITVSMARWTCCLSCQSSVMFSMTKSASASAAMSPAQASLAMGLQAAAEFFCTSR
jgi:hypothetical protein